MTEEHQPLLVFSTVDDHAAARRLAASLIEARVAACVNVLPPVTSVFRWESEAGDAGDATVQEETEVMLVAKTTDAAYPALEQRLRAEHPYDLPEIVAVEITRGLPEFLRWIDEASPC